MLRQGQKKKAAKVREKGSLARTEKIETKQNSCLRMELDWIVFIFCKVFHVLFYSEVIYICIYDAYSN